MNISGGPRTILVLLTVFAVRMFAADASASATRAFTVYAAGGRSVQNWHGQATLQSIHFEWSQAMRWKTQLAFDLAPYQIRQPRSWFGDQYHDGDETVHALAFAATLRRTYRPGSILRPYIEAGTGPMIASQRVPAATSHFNFATQAGFGIILMGTEDFGLYAGYRFTHVSNGGLAPRNPGLNVNGIVIGSRLVSR
jgi:hypothetical protein